MSKKKHSVEDFLIWQTRIEQLHKDVMPRFLHARICYEVKQHYMQRQRTLIK